MEIGESGQSQSVANDVGCLTCSYNLRGLRHEARCPECGSPVEDSRPSTPDHREVAAALDRIRFGLTVHFFLALPVVTYPLAATIGRMLIARGQRALADTPELARRPEFADALRKLADSGKRTALLSIPAWIPTCLLFCVMFFISFPHFRPERMLDGGLGFLFISAPLVELTALANNLALLRVCSRIADLDRSRRRSTSFALS